MSNEAGMKGASIERTPLEQAIQDFKRKLSGEELDACENTSLKELREAILSIRNRQSSIRTTRSLQSIEGFLVAMEENSKLIEDILGVNLSVGLVWTASNFANALIAVTDAYQKIADHMPRFAHYHVLFEARLEMRHGLELSFQDILEFQAEALKFFRGKVWRQTFDSLWKRFETRLKVIVDNIMNHKDLLDRQARLFEFEEARKSRRLESERLRRIEEAVFDLQHKASAGSRLAETDISQLQQPMKSSYVSLVFPQSASLRGHRSDLKEDYSIPATQTQETFESQKADEEYTTNAASHWLGKESAQDHTETVDSSDSLKEMAKLVQKYHTQKLWKEAEKLAMDALAAAEVTLGLEHLLTINLTYDVGLLLADEGKTAEAESMYRRAHESWLRLPQAKDQHVSTAVSLLEIAHDRDDQRLNLGEIHKRAHSVLVSK